MTQTFTLAAHTQISGEGLRIQGSPTGIDLGETEAETQAAAVELGRTRANQRRMLNGIPFHITAHPCSSQ